MAAMTSPSTSQAERKSFAITSIFFLPARGTLGSASADGMLIVGETGTIDAKLDVRSLVVLGSVVGEVTAKERVEVGPQGRVDGVVRTPRLKITEGAQVSARIEMGEPR